MATDKTFWSGRVEARPLAVFRALLACAVAYDLVDRLRDFHAFYTDDGIATRALANVHAWPPSAAPWLGSATAAGVVFAIGLVAAAALFAGWFTRAANVVALFAVVSIQERYRAVNDGGDLVLRLLLLWSLFVELGAVASLDVIFGRRARQATIPALPVRLLQLQVIVIHLCAGLAKHGDGWRDGTAVFRILHGEHVVRAFGRVIMNSPSLCTMLTYGTVAFELAFGVLVWAPWRDTRVRKFGLIVAHLFHAGIFLALKIGGFSGIMQIALIPFWAKRSDEKSPPQTPAAIAMIVLLLAALGSHLGIATENFVADLGIDQRWQMFAPDIPPRVAHLQFVGVASDGSERAVEQTLLDANLATALRYRRWDKLEYNLIRSHHPQRALVAAYLCRRWSSTQAAPLAEIRAQLVTQTVAAVTTPPTIETVYTQPCR